MLSPSPPPPPSPPPAACADLIGRSPASSATACDRIADQAVCDASFIELEAPNLGKVSICYWDVSALTLATAPFAPYPGYTGPLVVSGTVAPMTTAGTTQTFDYSLTGVDTARDAILRPLLLPTSGAGGWMCRADLQVRDGTRKGACWLATVAPLAS